MSGSSRNASRHCVVNRSHQHAAFAPALATCGIGTCFGHRTEQAGSIQYGLAFSLKRSCATAGDSKDVLSMKSLLQARIHHGLQHLETSSVVVSQPPVDARSHPVF